MPEETEDRFVYSIGDHVCDITLFFYGKVMDLLIIRCKSNK
jgi:hypothetical protein